MPAIIANTTSLLLPLYTPAGGGLPVELGDQHVRTAISAAATENAFTLYVLEAEPQASVPPHVHQDEEETFYILEGRFVGQVGDQTWEAGPGDTLYAPRQIVHTWTCVSEEGGRFLLLVSPGQNFETFFSRMEKTIAEARAGGGAELGPILGALAQEHGITMMPGAEVLAACHPTTAPRLVPAGDGRSFDLGDHRGWGKIGAQDSGNAFLLSEVQVDKNGGVPPHIHHREDEMFYVLAGRFVFEVGGQTIEAGVGDTVFAPRDRAHTFQCVSEDGGRMLALMTPGDNFQSFAIAMASQNIIPSRDMENPAAMQQLMAIAAEYGIDMLPPSIK